MPRALVRQPGSDLVRENDWVGVSRAAWAVVGKLGVVVLLALFVLIGSIIPVDFAIFT